MTVIETETVIEPVTETEQMLSRIGALDVPERMTQLDRLCQLVSLHLSIYLSIYLFLPPPSLSRPLCAN